MYAVFSDYMSEKLMLTTKVSDTRSWRWLKIINRYAKKYFYMAHLTDLYSVRGADVKEADVKEGLCDLTTLTFKEPRKKTPAK